MSKRSPSEFILLSISLFVFLVIVLMAPLVVYADNGHGHDHGTNTTAVDVTTTTDVTTGSVDVATGDVNIGGNSSRALALGNTLGDVDIAGCLGSTQWSTPVYGKQKLTLNWVCVAEFYIRHQQPDLAAMALCNTDILTEFASEEECEQAHSFLVPAAVQPVEEAHLEESTRVHDMQQMQLLEMQSQLEQIREMYERAPSPTVTRQVVQQPFLSEEKRAKLREVVEE